MLNGEGKPETFGKEFLFVSELDYWVIKTRDSMNLCSYQALLICPQPENDSCEFFAAFHLLASVTTSDLDTAVFCFMNGTCVGSILVIYVSLKKKEPINKEI